MNRWTFIVIACLTTSLSLENDDQLQMHFSERVSIPRNLFIKKQELTRDGRPLACSSSAYSLPNNTLSYQTLKIWPGTNATLIEIHDLGVKSRTQFFFVMDTILFAQCDLDDDAIFEIFVFYKNELPHLAFRRNSDGTLTKVEGKLFERVKLVCQTGSASKRLTSD